MRLKQHLDFVETLLQSRRDLAIEELVVQEIQPDRSATIRGQVRFWDGSLLEFSEHLALRGVALSKTRYAYHYQDRSGQLVFRYDNVPHHPGVATFPHHKHVRDGVTGVERVDVSSGPQFVDILREIDHHLYVGEA